MSGADDCYSVGMQTRREVLGDRHVDQATPVPGALDEEFQQFITEVAWGSLWNRPDLDRRTRSLVTIGILAALDRAELDLHLLSSRRLGVPTAEVMEVLRHVAVYAGIPAANGAVARVKHLLAGTEA